MRSSIKDQVIDAVVSSEAAVLRALAILHQEQDKPCPACEAHKITIRLLEEQLRLANMRTADAIQQVRRAQPRGYDELTPIHEMPAGQMENSLRRVYSPEGTEFVMVPNESPMPAPEAAPDEEVPA